MERLGDAGMEVRIHAGGSESGPLVYRRRFVPGETREVRLFLHGGDDRTEVRGERTLLSGRAVTVIEGDLLV